MKLPKDQWALIRGLRRDVDALKRRTRGYTTVQDTGTALTVRDTINFTGATVTDDATNNVTNVAVSGGGGVEFLDLWSKGEDTQVFSSGSLKNLHFNNASSTSSSWYTLYYASATALVAPYDEVLVDPGRYHIIAWANIQPLATSGGALVPQWMGMQLDAHDSVTFPFVQWNKIVDSRNFNVTTLTGPGNPANQGYFKLSMGATFTVGAGSNKGFIDLAAFRESTATSLTWNNYCGMTIAKLA